ncbi:MAG: Na/Pi cotransporter family protein [Paludibacteraceae bacterium]|nr:Na/Pi cotransporter family protein [Paludibacteraceae bacterium]
MSYTFYDFLSLIGALGMFLYGMTLMSEGLQKVAGDKLRSILTIMTKNRFMGVITGLLITTIIQSSSATTVMVVSFVNAGLLSLVQAISVIMGANIGTTVTAWVISLFGFKFSIADLSLPVIAISIPFLFSSNNKRKSFGELLIGFALLFLGLDLLKNSVPDLQQNPEILAFLQNFTGYGYGSVLLFLLIGTILTVVVQSSSATMAITLIMCSKGWLPFELAAAMVLGENIGTTITANIAAIPANVSARRAALAHTMFNVFGVVWALCLFYPFCSGISWLINQLGQGSPYELMSLTKTIDPATMALLNDPKAVLNPEQLALKEQYLDAQVATSFALSLFHTMFNVINTTVMLGFVGLIAKSVTWLIPHKTSDDEFRLTYISRGILSTSELSIIQADKEILEFAQRNIKMFNIAKSLFYAKNAEEAAKIYARVEKYEGISDRMEVEIAKYLTKAAEGRLSNTSKKNVHALLRVVSEIESIGDSSYNLAKTIMRKRNDGKEYSQEMVKRIEDMFLLVDQALAEMMNVLNENMADMTVGSIATSLAIEKDINALRNEYKMKNATDVKEQKYPYEVSVTYMDMVAECEKIGDYIVNVVEQYQETRNQVEEKK